MSALLKFEQEGIWQECIACGISFGMARSHDTALRRSHKTFYCPSGHGQNYTGENAEERLRKQLEQETAKREQAEREAEWAKAEARNHQTQRTKAQNKLKKIETRINAGVCPHCNRTFKQLAAHMKCKHGGK